MGKKTNWTGTEDQALCRAWLCASEAAAAHGGDQKAVTFWNVVHQLFHSELETSVERPVNGLKIRWTRINRDVQRFALLHARATDAAATRALAASSAAGAEEDGSARADAEPESQRDQQCVDEAIEQFTKLQGGKFSFELCWRMLRFSPKWNQLLSNSTGVSAGSFAVPPALVTADGVSHGDGGQVDVVSDISSLATLAHHKRRLASIMEAQDKPPSDFVRGIAASVVSELKRQSDLLEEQNAIALFQMQLDSVADETARTYFAGLRTRHVKRMRQSMEEEAKNDLSSAVSAEDANPREDSIAIAGDHKKVDAPGVQQSSKEVADL